MTDEEPQSPFADAVLGALQKEIKVEPTKISLTLDEAVEHIHLNYGLRKETVYDLFNSGWRFTDLLGGPTTFTKERIHVRETKLLKLEP